MMPVGKTYARPFLARRVAIVKVNLLPTRALPTNTRTPDRVKSLDWQPERSPFKHLLVNIPSYIRTPCCSICKYYTQRLYQEREILSLIHSRPVFSYVTGRQQQDDGPGYPSSQPRMKKKKLVDSRRFAQEQFIGHPGGGGGYRH